MNYYFIQLVMINTVKFFFVIVFFNSDAQVMPYLTINELEPGFHALWHVPTLLLTHSYFLAK